MDSEPLHRLGLSSALTPPAGGPIEEGKSITFFAYEELLAFKRAAKTLGLTKEDVEDIMYNNANNLIEGARRDIYGL